MEHTVTIADIVELGSEYDIDVSQFVTMARAIQEFSLAIKKMTGIKILSKTDWMNSTIRDVYLLTSTMNKINGINTQAVNEINNTNELIERGTRQASKELSKPINIPLNRTASELASAVSTNLAIAHRARGYGKLIKYSITLRDTYDRCSAGYKKIVSVAMDRLKTMHDKFSEEGITSTS